MTGAPRDASSPSWQPYVQALEAYEAGDHEVEIHVRDSLGGDESIPAATFFREPEDFFDFETCALDLCRGRVLDLGSGTGIHCLELQRRGLAVTGLEMLPALVELQRRRGVRHALAGDFFSWSEARFDTVLMLMNGIGPAGTLEGLDRFLHHAHRLVEPHGQLLLDSGEPLITATRPTWSWPGRPPGYPGEAWIQLGFGNLIGEPFRELYVDSETLAARAGAAGWTVQFPFTGEAGSYLARLVPRDAS